LDDLCIEKEQLQEILIKNNNFENEPINLSEPFSNNSQIFDLGVLNVIENSTSTGEINVEVNVNDSEEDITDNVVQENENVNEEIIQNPEEEVEQFIENTEAVAEEVLENTEEVEENIEILTNQENDVEFVE
jgi:hypothetical protein